MAATRTSSYSYTSLTVTQLLQVSNPYSEPALAAQQPSAFRNSGTFPPETSLFIIVYYIYTIYIMLYVCKRISVPASKCASTECGLAGTGGATGGATGATGGTGAVAASSGGRPGVGKTFQSSQVFRDLGEQHSLFNALE